MTSRVTHHSGQIIASQAAAALCLAAWGRSPAVTVAALLTAGAVGAAAWVRLNRRWLYQWLAVAASFATRRRTLPMRAGSPPADLLAWVSPGARLVADEVDGRPAGVIEDARGRTVLVELGDPEALLPGPTVVPPDPVDRPGIALRLVVAGAPATGSGVPAASYRQLTGGRVLARHRVVLAVQALREDGVTEAELRHRLSSVVRRRFAGRALTEAAAAAVLSDLAGHDGAQAVRERWDGLHLGGLVQATFEVENADIARLLRIPAAVVVAGATVRLAAPDPATLAVAERALAGATRLDGEHRRGLAATLPTCGIHSGPKPTAKLPPAGLMLGLDRRGEPVVVRFFRAAPTRIVLVGGPRTAQRLALRAMALGARVVVRSTRPQAWEPFVRWAAGPGESLPVVAAGDALPEPAGRPVLVVEDATREPAGPPEPWRTQLVVRDELAPSDVDLLAGADLAILQPLTPDEATLAGTALAVPGAEWFARIHGGMVAAVERRTVRWALLSGTELEDHLLGPAARG